MVFIFLHTYLYFLTLKINIYHVTKIPLLLNIYLEDYKFQYTSRLRVQKTSNIENYNSSFSSSGLKRGLAPLSRTTGFHWVEMPDLQAAEKGRRNKGKVKTKQNFKAQRTSRCCGTLEDTRGADSPNRLGTWPVRLLLIFFQMLHSQVGQLPLVDYPVRIRQARV